MWRDAWDERHAKWMWFVSRTFGYITLALACLFGLWLFAKVLWFLAHLLDRTWFRSPW
jgi:hypothetical protein